MNNRIDARLAALADSIRWRQQELKVDDLSRSLFDFEAELASLDAQGKAELLKELNEAGMGMTAEDVERMIVSYSRII